MRMNRVLPQTGLLAMIAGVMLTGCVVAGPPVVAAPPPIPVPRVEVVPPSPGPLFVWVPGYWGWHRSNYVWYGGRWATPPGRGYSWRAGYWESGRGGQVWREAGWRR
jgi:hypothetical protein